MAEGQKPLKLLYIEDDQRAAGELLVMAAERGDQLVWESEGASGLRRACCWALLRRLWTICTAVR